MTWYSSLNKHEIAVSNKSWPYLRENSLNDTLKTNNEAGKN